MTTLAVATHKMMLKTGGGPNDLGPIAHFFPRDVHAVLQADWAMWPVVIDTNGPAVSTQVLWFNPNGTDAAGAKLAQGVWNLSLDGTTWITNPSNAQFKAWLTAYLGINSGVYSGSIHILGPGATTPWIPVGQRGTHWRVMAGLVSYTGGFASPNILRIDASQNGGASADPTWNSNGGPGPRGIDGWGSNYGPNTHECTIKNIWENGTGSVGRTSIVVNDNHQTVHAPNGTTHWQMVNTSPNATARVIITQFG